MTETISLIKGFSLLLAAIHAYKMPISKRLELMFHCILVTAAALLVFALISQDLFKV